ncbi:MAG: FAD-dependent thymidylate synthase [Thermoanaerobacteraceae bacterium]|nr:FAD-dependent thymidylate synthase [Thermoanaerobacteraceae bacterium]
MKVSLLSYTEDPEKKVAAAARLCYSTVGAQELLEDLDDKKTAEFLRKLISMGHLSPLEHAVFTFAVEGVSRVLSHQMVRHRIASYSQKSQRYVSEHNFSYIIPPSIQKNPEALAKYREKMSLIAQSYAELAEIVPKEDARYILPSACETKFICTFNARSLLNFFQHRCCRRAQWEIRELAEEMLRLVRQVAPVMFEKAGATCDVYGVCYEGKMSCGRAKKIMTRG